MITKHHIIPKSVGGLGSDENIILVEDYKHRAFHTIFQNRAPTLEDAKCILSEEDCFNTLAKAEAMAILFPCCVIRSQCYEILEKDWFYKAGVSKKHRSA